MAAWLVAALGLLMTKTPVPTTSGAAKPVVPTRVDPVVETHFGVRVADPYRWLENGDAAEVQMWTAQQNALTRKRVDAYPGRAALAARLAELHQIGSLGVPVPKAKGSGPVRLFYTRREGQQNQAVLYVRDPGLARADAGAVPGSDRVLVDVNRLSAEGTMALDWWVPSEDGTLLAYGVSANGDENSALRVRDVITGHDRPEVITRARAASVAWLPDNTGFYYTRYPAPGAVPPGEDEYHRAVYFHRLGTDVEKDSLIFPMNLRQGRDMTDWPSVTLSPDGRWLVIEVGQGWAKTEVYCLDRWADARAKGAGFVTVVAGKAALFNVADVTNDAVYLLSNDGAPRYRLYAVDPHHPQQDRWREVIPERDETLEAAAVVGGRLAALYLKDASSRVRLFERDGKPVRDVALPGLGTAMGLSGRHEAGPLYVGFTSYVVPTQILEHDVGSGATRVWGQLAVPLASGDFTVEQVRYKSKDGTMVPMFLVHRRDVDLRTGKTPTLLYGYGGFNISLTPSFASAVAPFIEAGGVYAVANLRGGSEYGERWHEAGMLGRKQNVFDDFIAAGEYLIAEKITSPAHLAISGRSNGGLLVGATLTQRPDLFRAVVCGVPLLDMIRYPLFRIAKLWIPEYGDPAREADFRWLEAYSPYHHVKAGTAYPAVLLFTAASDTRVDPMHARKMTAALQAATSSERPILLRLETQAGHGAGKPIGKLLAQYTDELTFLFQELGMQPAGSEVRP